MRYFAIDTEGQLHQRSAPCYDVALRDVGPEGWARVRLPHTPAHVGPLGAFVNDRGLLMPDKYNRNVVGSLMLICLGANPQPYAGPVLLTGWQDDPWGDEPEVRGLSEPRVGALLEVHADVRRAVGMSPGEVSQSPSWRSAMVDMAEMVRHEPPRPVQFLTDPADVEAWLRGVR